MEKYNFTSLRVYEYNKWSFTTLIIVVNANKLSPTVVTFAFQNLIISTSEFYVDYLRRKQHTYSWHLQWIDVSK